MKIDDKSANAFCIDGGLLYKTSYPGLKVAATVNNLGTKPKFMNESDSLPLSARLGASYTLPKKTLPIPLLISLDTNLSPFYVSLGAESQINPLFTARLGYASGPADEGPGITCGLGIIQPQFSLDYAIKPYGELGLSHYVSLNAKF
ncbi:MAG: hypothetical protein QME07_05840, partial [bacterium]|nr:hypothetical protein [bacterium]